ncbi:uncharacterized protein LOC128754121 [Synchiropus splendidus]|uniref:uncharacterized protein LOC128754121 n=1 Tax=Synchiropus splendidus TaxID=270530 RepID=UPI00237DBFAA|nr:uncharacterized protein LOC128754121 [Synchiropus splendidus]
MEFFTLIFLFTGLLGTKADLVDTIDATPTPTPPPEDVTIVVTELPLTTEEIFTAFLEQTTTEMILLSTGTGLPPGTTKAATATITESPSTATLALKFSMNQEYTADLADSSTAAYKKLDTTVTTEVDSISQDLYGSDYVGSEVNSFTEGSVIVDMTLKFKSDNVVPSSTTAQEKLSLKLVDSSVLKVIKGSISIGSSNSTSSNATTAAPNATNARTAAPNVTRAGTTKAATATITESPSTATLALKFSMNQEYTADLADSSTAAYKKLNTTVTTEVDDISQDLYGSDYVGSEVNSFKEGSVIADMTLKFKSNDVVPSSNTAQEKLSSKIANSTVLKVIKGSISIVASNSTSSNATTAAANATNARTVAPNVTAAALTTASPSTQPASPSEGTLGLRFSLKDTFKSDLLNSSSDEFRSMATTVVKEVNKASSKAFSTSFRRSIANSFTNGSIVTDMTLVFKDKSSVPSVTNATQDLSVELLKSSLNIIPGSISTYSTSSSGCPAPPAAMTLTLLSLLLTRLARIAQ